MSSTTSGGGLGDGVLGDMITSVTPRAHAVPIPDMDVVPVLPGSKTNTPELMGDGQLESVDDECYHEGLYMTRGMEVECMAGESDDDEHSFDALYGRDSMMKMYVSKGKTNDHTRITKRT